MTPALVAGGSLAFIASIGNFGIPALLGMPVRYNVLTVLIYRKLAGFGPTVLGEVASLSVLLALLALVFIILQGRILMRRDFRATGTSATLLPYTLGRWRLPAEAARLAADFPGAGAAALRVGTELGHAGLRRRP